MKVLMLIIIGGGTIGAVLGRNAVPLTLVNGLLFLSGTTAIFLAGIFANLED